MKITVKDIEKIITLLEGYKFPIETETDEYRDSEKVTRSEFADAIVEALRKEK